MEEQYQCHAAYNECASNLIPHPKRRQDENQHAANHRSHLNSAGVNTDAYGWHWEDSILLSDKERAASSALVRRNVR